MSIKIKNIQLSYADGKIWCRINGRIAIQNLENIEGISDTLPDDVVLRLRLGATLIKLGKELFDMDTPNVIVESVIDHGAEIIEQTTRVRQYLTPMFDFAKSLQNIFGINTNIDFGPIFRCLDRITALAKSINVKKYIINPNLKEKN